MAYPYDIKYVPGNHNWNQAKVHLLVVQGKKCAICRCQLTLKTAKLDHDHKTGYIRGLLCHACNLAVGHIESRSAYLSQMLSYIRSPLKAKPQIFPPDSHAPLSEPTAANPNPV